MNITQIVNKNPKEPLEQIFRRKYDSRLLWAAGQRCESERRERTR